MMIMITIAWKLFSAKRTAKGISIGLTDTAEYIQYSEEMDDCQDNVWYASGVNNKIDEDQELDARALAFYRVRTIVYFLALYQKI